MTTNNVAEYRALIAGLEAAAPFRARVRARARRLDARRSSSSRGAWKVQAAAPAAAATTRRASCSPAYEVVDLAARAARAERRRRRARRTPRSTPRALMVLWLAFGVDLRASGTSSRAAASTSGSIAVGALLPLAGRRAVRRAGVRAHAARRRCSCSCVVMLVHRPAAGTGCGAGARSSLLDRLVRGPRARRRRGRTRRCSGGRRSARTRPERAAAPAVAGRSSSRSCSGSPAAWWVWARLRPRATAPGGATFWRTGPARDRGGAPRDPRSSGTARPRATATAGCWAASTRRSTDRGRAQARRARRRCSRASRSRASCRSPLRRARETARARSPRVMRPRGRGRRPPDRARLRRVGRRAARATSRRTTWARVARRPDVRAAGRRESCVAVTARVASFCARACSRRRRRRGRGEPRVADQGRGVLGARRRRARDAGACSSASRPSPASARRPDGAATSLSFNETAHLAAA